LAPFGDTFSEEEETEEESESVSRIIGLQFPGDWCTGKSGIGTGWDVVWSTLLSPGQNSKIVQNMVCHDLIIQNSTV
jgi:hypothetical protein